MVSFAVLGAGTFLAATAVWRSFVSNAWQGSFVDAFPIGLFLIVMLVLVPLHEGLHLIAYPAFGCSSHSWVGLEKKMWMPFVYFDDEISRNRHLLVLMFPFVGLSVAPFVVALLNPVYPFVALLSICNAAGSIMDIIMACFVALRVPRGAILRGDASGLYWRHG